MKQNQILTIDQIDQIIADTHKKHLETDTFINELMNIDISDSTENITACASTASNVNLNELTDNIFIFKDYVTWVSSIQIDSNLEIITFIQNIIS